MLDSQAAELDLQIDMTTTGSLTQARALTIEEPQDAFTLSRRAQSTLVTGKKQGLLLHCHTLLKHA